MNLQNFCANIIYSYLGYTDRFLDVFFLLLAVILSGLHEKQEGKSELQEKVHKRFSVTDITFLAALCPSYVIFVAFFGLLPPFRQLRLNFKKIVPENGEEEGRGCCKGGGLELPCPPSVYSFVLTGIIHPRIKLKWNAYKKYVYENFHLSHWYNKSSI